jgi:hypothetical protein
MSQEALVSLNLRVPPDLKDALDAMAARDRRPLQVVCIEALREAAEARAALPPRAEMLARAAERGLNGADAMGDEELYDALCDIGLARAVADDMANPTGEPRIALADLQREYDLYARGAARLPLARLPHERA